MHDSAKCSNKLIGLSYIPLVLEKEKDLILITGYDAPCKNIVCVNTDVDFHSTPLVSMNVESSIR